MVDGRDGAQEGLDAPAFVRGGGDMGRLIRGKDWSRTALGPMARWPAALRTTLRIVLTTNHPAFIFWGVDSLCFYNDAYSRSLGPEKHPSMLGEPAVTQWPEIWHVIGPQIEQVMSGRGATWHENQLVPIIRRGALEPVYWTYSYGPIDDDTAPNGVAGVLVICTETTQQVVMAERLEAQQRRWRALFDMAPGFICVLKGPEHRFEYANRRYMAMVQDRAVIGRTVVECLPEVVAQGFVTLLDRVYAGGQTHTANGARLTLGPSAHGGQETRYLNYVYEPIRGESGQVTGIFVEGHDVTEQALATEALADTLASITDGFCAFDGQWRILYVNSEAERLTRMTSGQLLGRSHWEVFPDTVGTELEAEYRRAAAGEPRAFEYFFHPWQRWFELRCYPRRGGGMTLYFQDATSRKQAEVARAEAQQRERERAEELETLMRSVPAFIWIAHDAHCARVTGNPNLYRLLGMNEGSNPTAAPDGSSADTRPFQELIDGRPADPQDLPLQRAARTGRAVESGVLSLVFDDGSRRHLWGGATPLHGADGTVRGAVAAFVDITELRAAQQQLEQSERQLQTLTDNSPDVLARFDRGLRHVFVNAAVERVTGRSRDQFIGRTNAELGMPEDLVRRWNAALLRVFGSGASEKIEFAMAGIDGRRNTHLSRLIAEPGPDGNVLHVLAIVQNVTEQRLAESAVRDAEKRKDEFLATLAHELRNPLAPLRTGLHILEHSHDPKTVTQMRSMMQRQLSHMVRLIDDLLDISRISAGKMTLRKELVSVQSVVESAMEASRPAVLAARHRLELDVSPEPLLIDGDVARLVQVLGNLLNNAAKYTPEGGRILLKVRRQDDIALIAVQDDGIGIPAEMQAEVFHMFAQVNTSLNRSQGGLGIGLALARSIVELHDGRIDVASPGLGGGSTFSIRLPVAPSVAAQPSIVSSNATPTPNSLRILLVDDNCDAVDSLAMLLRLAGHEVRTANDGHAGLQAALAWRPDAVFADIGMPGLDGHEFARRLRGTPLGYRPALVAVTGWGTERDQALSRQAGFDLHMTKPVAPEQVYAFLARCHEKD